MSQGQKLNFQKSMSAHTRDVAADNLQIMGRTLPAVVVAQSGKMVTVSVSLNSGFVIPELTVPLMGPQYIRYPMSKGDKGVLIPMNVYIGEMTGQSGIADLTVPQNLSAMVFLPFSNTEWQDVATDVVTMYGPEGVTLRDSASKTTFLLTPDSIVIATPSSFKVTVGGSVLSLTDQTWSLSGINGELTDGGGTTSPSVMQAAWAALKVWANTHTHADDGAGAPNQQLDSDIVNQ